VKLSAAAVGPGFHEVSLFPRSCGPECFTIQYRLRPGTTTITAHVASNAWRGGDAMFTVPAPIPAAKPQILRRVVANLKRTRVLHLTESVSSGPGSSTSPTGYTISGGAFLATDAFASGAVDVRELSQRDGLTELAFALPGSSIWYRIWVDSRYRLRRELIVDPGHFIRRNFS